MSLASDYARLARAPEFKTRNTFIWAWVTPRGRLFLNGSDSNRMDENERTMTPHEALEFAKWIVATFGETK